MISPRMVLFAPVMMKPSTPAPAESPRISTSGAVVYAGTDVPSIVTGWVIVGSADPGDSVNGPAPVRLKKTKSASAPELARVTASRRLYDWFAAESVRLRTMYVVPARSYAPVRRF